MRELVVLAIMISVINAFYDKTLDYWYSNDDGAAGDKLVSLNSIRSYNNNSFDDAIKSIEGVHHDLFSQRYEKLPRIRSRRIIPFIDFMKLKKGISWPAGKKDCVYGESMDIGCNKCICMSPMVYICTSNICKKKKGNKKNLKFLKEECIEGTTIESKGCATCYCMEGKIMCPITTCDVEKYKIKELTQLKKSIQEKNGVQCIPGGPVIIDKCNQCYCVGGIVICTLRRCDTGASKLKLKWSYNLNRCQPGTWYSPTGNPNCRPCYCLNDKYSYCYSGHCNFNEYGNTPDSAGFSWQPGGGWNWQPPMYPSKCKPGTKQKQGVCTFCTCDSRGFWSCNTNFDTCRAITPSDNDAYVLGTSTSCYGCRYGMGVWECYEAQAHCTDYDNTVMTSNTIFLNTKAPCSTCYADPVSGNICASDVTCAQKLYAKAKTYGKCSTDASCGKICNKQKKKIGKCLKGKCGCF